MLSTGGLNPRAGAWAPSHRQVPVCVGPCRSRLRADLERVASELGCSVCRAERLPGDGSSGRDGDYFSVTSLMRLRLGLGRQGALNERRPQTRQEGEGQQHPGRRVDEGRLGRHERPQQAGDRAGGEVAEALDRREQAEGRAAQVARARGAATAACSAVSTQPIAMPASDERRREHARLAPGDREHDVGGGEQQHAADEDADGRAGRRGGPPGCWRAWRPGCRRRRAAARAARPQSARGRARAARWRAGSAASRRCCRARRRRRRPAAGRAAPQHRADPDPDRLALAGSAAWRGGSRRRSRRPRAAPG